METKTLTREEVRQDKDYDAKIRAIHAADTRKAKAKGQIQ